MESNSKHYTRHLAPTLYLNRVVAEGDKHRIDPHLFLLHRLLLLLGSPFLRLLKHVIIVVQRQRVDLAGRGLCRCRITHILLLVRRLVERAYRRSGRVEAATVERGDGGDRVFL